VPQDDGPKTEAIVNVAITVSIPDVCAIPLADDKRILVAPVAEIRIHAVGDDLGCPFEQSVCFSQIS
jgi:hypothetical protein